MKTTTRALLIAATLAGGLFAFRQAHAQDPVQEPSPEEMAAMMEQMQKLATPGEMHKILDGMVGTWDLKMEMFSPGMPPMVSGGTSEITSVLGGRYIQEMMEGSFMGQPFHGMNLIGYSNATEEFHSSWRDNFSTWPTTSTGHWDAETKTLEMKGIMRDVADMDGRPYRMVSRMIDDDNFVADMYDTIPPHGDIKVMTITYTRG